MQCREDAALPFFVAYARHVALGYKDAAGLVERLLVLGRAGGLTRLSVGQLMGAGHGCAGAQLRICPPPVRIFDVQMDDSARGCHSLGGADSVYGSSGATSFKAPACCNPEPVSAAWVCSGGVADPCQSCWSRRRCAGVFLGRSKELLNAGADRRFSADR